MTDVEVLSERWALAAIDAVARNKRIGYTTGSNVFVMYCHQKQGTSARDLLGVEDMLGPEAPGWDDVADLESATPTHFIEFDDQGDHIVPWLLNLLQSMWCYMRSCGANVWPDMAASTSCLNAGYVYYNAGVMNQPWPRPSAGLVPFQANADDAVGGFEWGDVGIGTDDNHIHVLMRCAYKWGTEDRRSLPKTMQDIRGAINNVERTRQIWAMYINHIRPFVEEEFLKAVQSDVCALAAMSLWMGLLRADLPPDLRSFQIDPTWSRFMNPVKHDMLAMHMGAGDHQEYDQNFFFQDLLEDAPTLAAFRQYQTPFLVDPRALEGARRWAGAAVSPKFGTNRQFMNLWSLYSGDDNYATHGKTEWYVGLETVLFINFETCLNGFYTDYDLFMSREHFTWNEMAEIAKPRRTNFTVAGSLQGRCDPDVLNVMDSVLGFETHPAIGVPFFLDSTTQSPEILADGNDFNRGDDFAGNWAFLPLMEHWLTPNDYIHFWSSVIAGSVNTQAMTIDWMFRYATDEDVTTANDGNNVRWWATKQIYVEYVNQKDIKIVEGLMYRVTADEPRFESLATPAFSAYDSISDQYIAQVNTLDDINAAIDYTPSRTRRDGDREFCGECGKRSILMALLCLSPSSPTAKAQVVVKEGPAKTPEAVKPATQAEAKTPPAGKTTKDDDKHAA